MAVDDSRTITISDDSGPAYELTKINDEVRIQMKRIALNPPAVKLVDLTDAVARLNRDA